MFLAVGSGAYVAAIFHMVTHAFFKAPALPRRRLGHPRPARRAGHASAWARCASCMPITAATFIIGWLAIAGDPAVLRLLVEGRDPAVRAATRARRCACVGLRHRPAHRLLHEPPGDPGLLRQGPLGRTSAEPSTARHGELSKPPREPASVMLDPRTSRRWPMTLPLGGIILLAGRRRGCPTSDHRQRPRALARAGHRVRRAPHRRHVALRHQVDPRARRHGRRPSSGIVVAWLVYAARAGSRPLEPPVLRQRPGTTTTPSPPSWAARAASASTAPPGSTSTSSTAPSTASPRCVRGAGRRAAQGARPATSATTPGSSASAPCSCSPGSSSSEGCL